MALKLCSIASGSRGNCIFVASNRTSLIVDCGVSLARVNGALVNLGVSKLDGAFLTHVHSDHFRHVPDLVGKGVPLHYHRILRSGVQGKVEGDVDEFCGDVIVGDVTVESFPLSHDVPCYGYSFYSEGSKVSVVTDLGVMPKTTLEKIADSDAVLIEANYDEEMLRNNTQYPEYLKRRIASARGHLSNVESAECVAFLVQSGVKNVMLGHLSEHNNTPELALKTVSDVLGNGYDYNLMIALQNEVSGVIEV